MASQVKCIVIDDSLFVRKTLVSLISSLGHQVVGEFGNAEDALVAIPDTDHDIIFLDIILPNISGLEALKMILSQNKDEKVIVLSGLGDEDVINAALQLGAIDYIQKPIDEIQLRRVFERIIESYFIPDAVTLSKIEATAKLVSIFFDELLSIATYQVRRVIKSQIDSLFLNPPEIIPKMFKLDPENFGITTNEEIFGIYEEEEVIYALNGFIEILKNELSYIYSEDFINRLFQSAMLAIASKPRTAKLVAFVNPEEIGIPLPDKVNYDQFKFYLQKSQLQIEDNLLLATVFFGSIGPEMKNRIGNEEMVPENTIVKSSIFYFTLVGFGNEKKGLFGPLPVSDLNDVSAVFFSLYPLEDENNPNPISTILILFYRYTADKIVEDINKLNFIFRTRLGNVKYLGDISKPILRGIMEDLVEYYREIENA